MKNVFLLFSIILLSCNFCTGQEWFTSFDVAKRMALIQDKLLFVIWEDALNDPYPLLITTDEGKLVVIDLSQNENADAVIWEHFVPVLLPESTYNDLLNTVKNKREFRYIDKLNDNTIKIMDVNRNILNVNSYTGDYQNLSLLIKNYAINTSFIKQDLVNYSKKKNFTTAIKLGSKYIDLAIFAEKDAREEVIDLANIYLNEAKSYLQKGNMTNKEAFLQRLRLLKIKEQLVISAPKKALRQLKRIKQDIYKLNKSMHIFLNYTTFKFLKDEENTAKWQSEISSVDLKKAQLILNNN